METVHAVCDKIAPMGLESMEASRNEYALEAILSPA